MKESEHILMSKELVDLLGKNNQTTNPVEDTFDLFKHAKIIVGKEECQATITNIQLDDFNIIIKAITSINTILFLLRSAKDKKLKLPEILPQRNDFVITSLEVEGNGIFKLTAVVVNT